MGQYLTSGRKFHTPEMLDMLRSYDFVVYNGRKLQTKNLVHELVGCEDCNRLLLRVSFLEASLKKYECPMPVLDLQVVLAEFFDQNYRRTSSRVYSRRVLFREVQGFLYKEFGIRILHATDGRYRDFICKVVKD